MAQRDTVLLKHENIGPAAKPQAIVITYRSRKRRKGGVWKYRTLILDGGPRTTILDWPDTTSALQGHERVVAKLNKGEPILEDA